MKKTAEKTKKEMRDGLGAAVEEAYLIVTDGLKYTHEQLCNRFDRAGLNCHTLNRIRDGKPRKPDTDWRYLHFFAFLIDEAYKRTRQNGFEGTSTILEFNREIFLLLLGLPTEKDMPEEC